MRVRRRQFLIGCGQAAAAALVPGRSAHGFSACPSTSNAEFHLEPHYREHAPLEAVLGKRIASNDDFVLERYHDRIARGLAKWSEDLRESRDRTQAIEEMVASGFEGCTLRPSASKARRMDDVLEIEELSFGPKTLRWEAFKGELNSYLSGFSRILTADFQVTGIDEVFEGELRTRVRYEFVGTGKEFYREQRSGIWELTWSSDGASGFRLQRLALRGETRSRCRSQIYEDITRAAFGANESYSTQLVHGVDYWRTVLDGACGIDIYGHNGVSVGDFDGDGLDDLYVCQPAGLPNRLYRNRGDGTFEDVTESAGVGVLENTACAIFADFDNDGRQDLIVVRANGPLLFWNEGNGSFRRKPDAFQFENAPQGTFTGAAAADYDSDGWLDIYFCLYVYYQGADQYKYPTPYYDANDGPPNFLMRNNRDGTFRDATAQAGLNQNNTRYSFCCGWTDSNGDGWPDLYVANDFGRKNLYRNNWDGTFKDIAAEAGVEDVGAGMSVCCLDYDNDGAEDLYVADMWTAAGERIAAQENFRKSSPAEMRALYRKHAMGNSLFRNTGSGVFEDRSAAAGAGMGRWSWSSDAWDFDHDGYPDIYIANGMISGPLRDDLNSFFWRRVVAKSPDQAQSSREYEQGWNAVNELIRADYSWSGYERNVCYANNRGGTFCDVSGALGLDFTEDGRAFGLADFDGDGRLEMLLKNRNGPQLRLMKNVGKELPPSICFRLRGTRSNRDAIGATITVETELGRQTRMLQAGSGFLSQHGKEVFFGLGSAKGRLNASIRWPSGLMQALEGLMPNTRLHVVEGSEQFRAEPFRQSTKTDAARPQASETLPNTSETWLLAPVMVPDFWLKGDDGRTWTLSALGGKPGLLCFWTSESESCGADLAVFSRLHAARRSRGQQLLTVNLDRERRDGRTRALPFPVLAASDDMAAIFNILFRSLFDRHRDLTFPTSLLINAQGEIVKIYQGPLNAEHVERDFETIPGSAGERLRKALPFAGDARTFAFGRNHLSLGSTYFQRGYFDQAQVWFLRALDDDPSSAEAQYGLGSVYLKQSKNAEARSRFERAAQLPASYPDTKANAWNNLGLLATREGRMEEAIGFFKEALQLNPDHAVALENLGNAYRQEKRWEEARSVLERAVRVSPEDPEANYSLGMVYAQADQPDRAYEYLQRALKYRPDYPEAMNNLGVLYLRTGRRDEAVAELEKCIQAAPDFGQAYMNLARVYAIEGDREKARGTLEALLRRHPDDAQAQRALAELK